MLRPLVPTVTACLLALACGSESAVVDDGGSGGSSSSSVGGGGTALVGPPFDVGPTMYGSYLAFDTQGSQACTVSMSFAYRQPAAEGRFPVFVFAKGTRGEWDADSLIQDEMLGRMAERGFVAVSPDYQSNIEVYPHPLDCASFRAKAACMFSPAAVQAESLVAVLERDTKADPALGIITSGISQGGFVALLAAEFHPEVRGSNPISIGTFCGSALDLTSCATAGAHALDPTRVRIANGESDATFGGVSSPECNGTQVVDPVWYRDQLNAMAGQACDTSPATYACLRPDGSGWIMARDDQVADGLAHHAFPYASYPSTADPLWATTTEAWGREANQAWLAGLITP